MRLTPLLRAAQALLTVTSLTLAAPVTLKVDPSHPRLLANQSQRVVVKVGLEGIPLPGRDRPPVNVSLVIDRSGSMGGDKIVRAREAAAMVVDMLGPQDIFSLVTFSSDVETLIPATRLTDKREAHRRIEAIRADGNTALFGGVSKGMAEVRKFQERGRVNRVIVISDGMANVGPSSPTELGALGRSAARELMSISTIGLGLGYNEDLMVQLAQYSDGNHAFAETGTDLARIFNSELGDLLSVVAQEVEVQIQCPHPVKVIRILDREAEIRGSQATLRLNQIYGNQEKYVLLEVEVPARSKGDKLEVAQVQVSYHDPLTRKRSEISAKASVAFTASESEVRQAANRPVQVQAAKARANVATKEAVVLRDKGDAKAAQEVMRSTAVMLGNAAKELDAPELAEEAAITSDGAGAMAPSAAPAEWNKSRKIMREKQHKTTNQSR